VALAASRFDETDVNGYSPIPPVLTTKALSWRRARLTIARKLARRSYHVLHQLGAADLHPIPTS